MDLSIVIISWNTSGLLAQCLHSIYTNPPCCTFESLVVDNASSDDSVSMVRGQFPKVQLIENPTNVGFARANNQAIRASTGKHILLLNSDTIVQPSSLQNMHTFMLEHPEVGIVGAFILNSDRTPQLCFGKFPTLVSEAAYSWGLDSRLPLGGHLARGLRASANWLETDWVMGAALMTKREVVKQTGGLDEAFFMYSEEIDFAYRAKKAGWKTFVLRNAPIIHLGHQSSDKAPDRMKAELFRSKVRYFEKHRGHVAALLLRAIFALSILTKRWFYLLAGRQAQSRIWANTWSRYAG